MTTAGHGTGHGTERPARSTLEPLPGSPLSRFLSDGYVATWRNIKKIVRVPDILVFTLIQPIMFVLLFTFVFGSSIDVPGEDYTSFLMAGIFAQTIVFGSTYSGSAMAQDLKDGIIDRFRTLPMNPSAVLIGRTLGDLVINVLSLVVMMLTGLAVGWRVESSAADFAIGVGLLALFSYAFSWVMAFLGILVRSPEVINNASFLILFPATFISNAFVPSENLPGPLRIFAEWNPVSALVQAVRELFGNAPTSAASTGSWPLEHPVVYVLIFTAGMFLVFVPLSVRRFQSLDR
ncbi:ABC transporter permease [Microbacterium sp. UBA3394]|uniref:ABC transporter permease n=1 Tax=unclassified Microbacterium TaxID=2609290 RepID=UPI000C4CC5B3|nr:ABC transporter permease [Microbacterium sp. UBA3394]MAB19322.1 ABC transporter [Microbacterium sp.]|tara:strand:+ start:1239 stop:2111 length:873 start_codon:yes stop_codon:yes gene_type:complete